MLRNPRTCWSVIGLLLLVGAVQAEPGREQSLAEMDQQKWTARDGAPQGITELAQGADGTLWIGSDSGLFSFDGRTFSAFRSPAGAPELPVESIDALLAARDGTLWVGFFQAGVARIQHGRVTVYAKVDEKRMSVMEKLHEARDGSIWATSQRRIVRFGADQQWHDEPPPLDNQASLFAFLDSSDTLWVAQGARLYRRDIREPRYSDTGVAVDWMFGVAEVPDGTLWIADYDGIAGAARLQHIDRLGRLITRVSGIDWAPAAIVHRPDGSLIYASQHDGLRLFPRDMLPGATRAAQTLHPEEFMERHGLSSDSLKAVLRDADGTLWVGGGAGLNRFKPGSLIPLSVEPKAGNWSVCANEGGEVWVSNRMSSVYRIADGKTRTLAKPDGVAALFCGRDGHTWMVDRTPARGTCTATR